jgi:hypothetical protein
VRATIQLPAKAIIQVKPVEEKKDEKKKPEMRDA